MELFIANCKHNVNEGGGSTFNKSAALSRGGEQNDMRAFPALHCLMHKSDLAERDTHTSWKL